MLGAPSYAPVSDLFMHIHVVSVCVAKHVSRVSNAETVEQKMFEYVVHTVAKGRDR